MKPIYFAHAAVVLVGAATVIFWPKPEAPSAPPPVISTATADGMHLTTATDPTLVFQRAFWRRPASDDKILHAERREWSTDDGVQKWQWFIAVSPSAQLLDYLETNPFSLVTTRSTGVLDQSPKWFPGPSSDFEIHRNAEGRFILMLSADHKHLYASDSGSGFSAPSIAP